MGGLVLGLEEAGRGPVIGPMTICGVLIEDEKIKKLMEIGVKDSKMLSPEKRKELFPQIQKLAKKHCVISVSPEEIDGRESNGLNLNELEAVKMAEIINELKPDKAIIDTPSVNIKSFEKFLKTHLTHECELVCEHKADIKYPVVSAASILAKVVRDAEIMELERKLNLKIGSGYPSDPETQKFLEKYWSKLSQLPFVRKTWATVSDVYEKKTQKNINDFF
ncbi:MAG: ribonuclease HII [Nanoarchaeota archaeon]|nr:ribonuclease HII [Nanoarchaeota archaeon]